MNEWLAIMLEEIDRKKRETEEAEDETECRASAKDKLQQKKPDKNSD